MMPDKILDIHRLIVDFHTDDGVVHAVRGVTYALGRGESIGIVGESGSGKSVTHLALMGLLPDSAKIRTDATRFGGRNLFELPPKDLRKLRGREIAMIFQDPMTALNPYLTLGTQIAEMFRLHHGLRGGALDEATIRALAQVGIPKPELRVEQYPHEFSGGMRQRAMIAMMLAAKPSVLIADEPTTALDVTVQAQILRLLKRLQKEQRMSIVLITHDLAVVAGFTDRVLVMYAGRIVERARTADLFSNPLHPYTKGLLASIPRLDRDDADLEQIHGQPPDLSNIPHGCPFLERCSYAEPRCETSDPELMHRMEEHHVACHVVVSNLQGTAPREGGA
ncbi:MAG: ABC transporter ATP-binding protein [Gaiellales bacterium]